LAGWKLQLILPFLDPLEDILFFQFIILYIYYSTMKVD